MRVRSLTARLFHYSRLDAKLVLSITIPQMATTLASAVVGYQTQDANGHRMLSTEFVNAVLVLGIVTCVAGPILSERWGKKLKKDSEQLTD